MNEKNNRKNAANRKYEAPSIRSFTSQELLERIGPAQGISSGTPGTGRGVAPIDEIAGRKSGGSISR